jgi:hypothetical protein
LSREILHGRDDEALSHFEGRLDLDPGGGPRIHDGDGASKKSGEEIDDPDGYEKLGADRPLIPKLLQHV